MAELNFSGKLRMTLIYALPWTSDDLELRKRSSADLFIHARVLFLVVHVYGSAHFSLRCPVVINYPSY